MPTRLAPNRAAQKSGCAKSGCAKVRLRPYPAASPGGSIPTVVTHPFPVPEFPTESINPMSSVQSSVSPLGVTAPTAVVLGVVLDRTGPLAYTGSPTQTLAIASLAAVAVGVPLLLWARKRQTWLRRTLVAEALTAALIPALFMHDVRVGQTYVLAVALAGAFALVACARCKAKVALALAKHGLR